VSPILLSFKIFIPSIISYDPFRDLFSFKYHYCFCSCIQVKLETLGTFQLQVRSEGAATKKEFTQANIKKTTIQFRPGTLVKDLTNASSLSFTRVLTKVVSGSTTPVVDPDTPVIPVNPGEEDDPNG
jgi:hypothetical protein